MMGGLHSLLNTLKKRRKIPSGGFTIVETMIVLAVTGLLFVSFASSVSGRQNKVRFQQAINTVKTQLEQVISETQSGYFPDVSNFNCIRSGNTITIPNGVGVGLQGRRKDCVFLGKVVQFTNCTGSGTKNYMVHSIAGLKDAADFASSDPTVIEQITDTRPLQFGLCVDSMRFNGNSIGAVGFMTFFSEQDGMPKGTQATQIIPIDSTDLDDSNVNRINNNLDDSYADRNPPGGVEVCFVSGTTDQSGLITIGASNSMNSVKLEIKNNRDCS